MAKHGHRIPIGRPPSEPIQLIPLEYGAVVNDCSGHPEEHDPDCTQTCEKKALSNAEVDLHNEQIEWTKRGMIIQGVPASMRGAVPGIPVELLSLEMKLAALITLLIDEGIIDEQRATDAYLNRLVSKLKGVREAQEKKSNIAVARSNILGPDGEIMQ